MRFLDSSERGQALSEFAMIILAVVIVVAATMVFLGPQIVEFIEPIIESMQ